MLKHLKLVNVGPSNQLEIDLGQRLNLITGDNGLGKSFLLDVIWWALTRKWPAEVNPNLTSGYVVRPTTPERKAEISFQLKSKTKLVEYSAKYSAKDGGWVGKAGRPWNPGLVLYAHADGAFSIWDPARNYWRTRGGVDIQDRIPAYVFSPKEVWDGKSEQQAGRESVVSNGLIRDWATWINAKGVDARRMVAALKELSPSQSLGGLIVPGPLMRVGDDARDVPSVSMPYGVNVPIVHASAGIKRIVALAYMLVWAWREHVIAAERLGEARVKNVVMIVDEIESHLHPKWQRSILSALIGLNKQMYRDASIQLVISTHSPLVLASAEQIFDDDCDKWFDLDLEAKTNNKVSAVLTEREFVKRGTVSNWLTSEAFDLDYAGSQEAEAAMKEAKNLVSSSAFEPKKFQQVHELLRAVLPDTDPFWIRWNFVREKFVQPK